MISAQLRSTVLILSAILVEYYRYTLTLLASWTDTLQPCAGKRIGLVRICRMREDQQLATYSTQASRINREVTSSSGTALNTDNTDQLVLAGKRVTTKSSCLHLPSNALF